MERAAKESYSYKNISNMITQEEKSIGDQVGGCEQGVIVSSSPTREDITNG